MPLIRINIKATLLIVFCCFLIYGCKKHHDYRDKFLGNYRFAIHLQTYMGIAPPNYSTTDTTYYYNGKIELGTRENTVLIFFTEQSSSNNWYEPFESIIYENN